ncbi:hypothetical protein [Heyndrickxia ginsengihumi]|uniref:hypothetical protein n=1 Tax=Heyndrickxia ginsengihumi TaxID=363870 RepID=UPI00046E6226|nr:hypothetical protein [Heyndrickxia ginsengihumi]
MEKYMSTTYRILPFFNTIFYSCYTIYQRDRLTEYLLRNYFQSDEILSMPIMKKGELLELMINNTFKFNSKQSIESLRENFNSDRILELREIFIKHGEKIKENRIPFTVRITAELKESITKFEEVYDIDTVGEIIEISIAAFIENCPEIHYQMFKMAYLSNFG